jgi:CheY-like chemotaxis protein
MFMASILLLEDHADMQAMLRELLEWDGHHVSFGRTGEEGLDVLQDTQRLPDLIISDLLMPMMDGLEFLVEVRKNPAWADIRFVIMSANPADERLTGPEAAGLDGILPKPFTVEELNRILR